MVKRYSDVAVAGEHAKNAPPGHSVLKYANAITNEEAEIIITIADHTPIGADTVTKVISSMSTIYEKCEWKQQHSNYLY